MVFTPMIHICMLRGCDFYANPTQHLSWILSVHCCELLHSSFACCIIMKLLRKELFFSFFKCNRTELKTTLNVWLTFTLNSVPNVSMYLLETSHATNYGTGLGLYVFNKVRRGKKTGQVWVYQTHVTAVSRWLYTAKPASPDELNSNIKPWIINNKLLTSCQTKILIKKNKAKHPLIGLVTAIKDPKISTSRGGARFKR